jgi:protein TonB
MARAPQASRFRRPLAAAGVVVLHAALIALLLRPMLVPTPPPAESLILVDVPPPPPPAPAPEPPAAPKPEAAAAPPAPRKRPRPIAAPTPPVPAPSPVATAPSDGTETASGAATAGPGTGASGTGAGSGSGGSGPGGGATTRPRWQSGRIDRRDYPADASRAGLTGSVTVTLDIAPDGRVTGCRIARSSGSPSLDRTTCALIEQRFRFEPARDAAGTPVPGIAGWRQDWWLEPPR